MPSAASESNRPSQLPDVGQKTDNSIRTEKATNLSRLLDMGRKQSTQCRGSHDPESLLHQHIWVYDVNPHHLIQLPSEKKFRSSGVWLYSCSCYSWWVREYIYYIIFQNNNFTKLGPGEGCVCVCVGGGGGQGWEKGCEKGRISTYPLKRLN